MAARRPHGEALRVVTKAGAVYFACVFGAGFVLGAVRVPLLVPRLGARVAELIEMPLMFCAIVLCARWIVRRFALPPTPAARLGVGVFALALLLLAEFTLALWLQGATLAGYLASREPRPGLGIGLRRDADRLRGDAAVRWTQPRRVRARRCGLRRHRARSRSSTPARR